MKRIKISKTKNEFWEEKNAKNQKNYFQFYIKLKEKNNIRFFFKFFINYLFRKGKLETRRIVIFNLGVFQEVVVTVA